MLPGGLECGRWNQVSLIPTDTGRPLKTAWELHRQGKVGMLRNILAVPLWFIKIKATTLYISTAFTTVEGNLTGAISFVILTIILWREQGTLEVKNKQAPRLDVWPPVSELRSVSSPVAELGKNCYFCLLLSGRIVHGLCWVKTKISF